MAGLFLGGSLAPAGISLNVLRSKLDETIDVLVRWRGGLGHKPTTSSVALREACQALEPFQAVWSREVLFDCGDWTIYMNNSLQGGDPTASASHIGRVMGVDVLTAMHSPVHPPGHGATQLWIRPSGSASSLHTRDIVACAADGRWSWDSSGEPFPFEDQSRYTARRIRDRFDRPLLIDYLGALGIRVDDADFYGRGVRVQQGHQYKSRELTAAELRVELGLA